MNVPPFFYAVSLIKLMQQQGVHRFEVDMASLDPAKEVGVSINFELEDGKLTVSFDRCDCPSCVASAGGTQ